MKFTAHVIELRRDFKQDRHLVDRILDLTRATYLTNEELVEREIEHNRDIYIIADRQSGVLQAFFMVNFEEVRGVETFYLGLSACREELRGQGLAKALYLRFLDDCADREREAARKYLLWWTTATPIVYYWFNKHLAKVQPDMEGRFDSFGATAAHTIRRERFPHALPDPHPFILRAVAGNTFYSPREKARLSQAAETLGTDVFRVFGLVEENADRFLMIGYAP